MRIFVAGEGGAAIHEVAVVEAFRRMGHQVEAFYWRGYFSRNNTLFGLLRRLQNKFIIGPAVANLNADILKSAIQFRPDVIFIYRGTHILADTVSQLKYRIPFCKVIGYNNDDPFSSGHPPWLQRHFLASLPYYDVVYAYRKHNVADFLGAGAKSAGLLRSWYIPELHKKTTPTKQQLLAYECDCIYVGHYENDGRDRCIEELVSSGINVRVFGPYGGLGRSGWDIPVSRSNVLQRILPIKYLQGSAYVSAISSAPIALCFLSKLNRDTYTRRCFEIPAIGSALFSEYSDDLAELFIDGEEAVFFRDKHELVEKVAYYLQNKDQLDELRKRGMERVICGGHDIYSRLRAVVEHSL